MKEPFSGGVRESTGLAAFEAIAAFRDGAVAECADFDFLIGDWTVRGTRYAPDGCAVLEYQGAWHAEHLCERRMVFDHFTAFVEGGGAFAFFATLRTWSPSSRQWEMTFLTAMQPHLLDRFTGRRVGEEMHLHAAGRDGSEGSVESRVRFHDVSPDGFAWEQTTSRDGGSTWILEARIRARRREIQAGG